MHRVAISLALLWFSACGFAREVNITILHTCDLHAHLLPTTNYEGQTNMGGLARCATAIRKIRETTPNVLLVDAGDTIQGAPFGYLSDGQVMVKALNFLHYDAWVWGNHEFDWGLDKLAACAERAEMPILNANVSAVVTNLATENAASRVLSRIKPYIFREFDGVKIAIVGVNTPGIPNWSRPRLIDGLKFEDSVDALRRWMREIQREKPDIIVAICHQGFREGPDDHANQIRDIALYFPEIDVIIGGHTHRLFPQMMVYESLYAQAGYWGSHVGRVDLQYDTEKRKLVRRTGRLLKMDETVPLDADFLREFGGEIDAAHKKLSVVIGEATAIFSPRGGDKRETPMHHLFFDAIRAALAARGVEADAIFHGILNERAKLLRGPITVGDVWEVVPYENTIGVLEISGAQLRELLEENAQFFGTRRFRGVWGARVAYEYDDEKKLRVASVTDADGNEIPNEKRLKLAVNSYELASGGTRFPKLRALADDPACNLVEFDFQTREAVMDFVRERGKISPKTGGWWRVTAQ
jgi:2',3'-cyclic-nucleotide 2'-phosphodiesterase (5'-nucleotidase family)